VINIESIDWWIKKLEETTSSVDLYNLKPEIIELLKSLKIKKGEK